MAQQNAEVFQREIMGLFFAYFGNFILYEPRRIHSPFVYYYNYKKSGLSIVVFLPLVRNKDWQTEMTDDKIRISLKKTNDPSTPHLVELVDTRLIKGWEDRIRERVGILKELVETEVHKCDDCNVVKIPKTMRRNNLERTWFVGLQCPKCHKYTWTIFGRGLKTRLHRNLKRRRGKNG